LRLTKHLVAGATVAFIVMGLSLSASWAWRGKVVGVADGDTITVLHNGRGERIRLYGIDCPEKRQDFGRKAKQFTSSTVFGKIVEVEPMARGRYGRTVGILYPGGSGISLNEMLIRSGYAWVYVRYCRSPICREWAKRQDEARRTRVGLWSMPNPIPPWSFRHGKGR